MAKADLHIHTTASDGKMAPEEVVKTADELKLSVISITDHDTIRGLKKARLAADSLSVELMTGVEITTLLNKRECHLLAYNFDIDDVALNNLLKRHKKARVQRAKWIIDQLGKKGLELDINEVMAEAAGGNVGRPHIAEILLKKGYIATPKEAYIRYLSDEALGPIQSNYASVEEVIQIVRKAGGVTALAHPGRMYNEQELLEFVELGIDALEAKHPSHNYEIQKAMETFAERHHLITTGGSDFHGELNSYYRHLGVLTINMEQVKKIRALTEHRIQASV